MRALLGKELEVDPNAFDVRLVAQHAFEYYAMREEGCDALPPHLLRVTLDGRDVTEQAESALKAAFPFPYDLHFNRVTASAAIEVFRAFAADGPVRTHLPGVLGLPGGYPVVVDGHAIRLDLADGWDEALAAGVNEESLHWDGIASIEEDGTVHYTEETSRALHAILGRSVECITPDNAAEQATALLAAL